jgi:hypothetical protein
MADRDILDTDPDPAALLDELYFEVERGFLGVPLGQVAAHASRRYTACYGVLCLARLLTQLGAIDAVTSVRTGGAEVQDKQTTHEFPSAHAVPCDLVVMMPLRPAGVNLYDLLRNRFNRMWVRRNVFGQTDRVHRLVNVADAAVERGSQGIAAALARSCEQVIRATLQARLITRGGTPPPATSVMHHFTTVLVPDFTAAARNCRQRLESRLTEYEMTEMMRGHLVDRFGNYVAPQPTDTRLSSPSRDARAAARISLLRIFETYADENLVDRESLESIEAKVGALRQNEWLM